jgi:trans-aconitate methyltransferase
MPKRDVVELFEGGRGLGEVLTWIMNRTALRQWEFVGPMIAERGVRSVVEYGCGAGLLASWIPEDVDYLGVDRSGWMLDRARVRCPRRRFVSGDVRSPAEGPAASLALCFGVFKSLGPDEWATALTGLLGTFPEASFDVQVADRCLDKGADYYDLCVSEAALGQAIAAGGHAEVRRDVWATFDVPAGQGKGVALWTTVAVRGSKQGLSGIECGNTLLDTWNQNRK